MKTMYGRQFATMVGMVLLSFLMLGASFATLSYQYTIREKKDTLERNAKYIAQFTSNSVNVKGSEVWRTPEFQNYLSAVAKVSDSHVIVTTPEGLIVYASSGDAALTGLQYAPLTQQMVNAILNGPFTGMTTLDGLYGEPRYLVGPSPQWWRAWITCRGWCWCPAPLPTSAGCGGTCLPFCW